MGVTLTGGTGGTTKPWSATPESDKTGELDPVASGHTAVGSRWAACRDRNAEEPLAGPDPWSKDAYQGPGFWKGQACLRAMLWSVPGAVVLTPEHPWPLTPTKMCSVLAAGPVTAETSPVTFRPACDRIGPDFSDAWPGGPTRWATQPFPGMGWTHFKGVLIGPEGSRMVPLRLAPAAPLAQPSP